MFPSETDRGAWWPVLATLGGLAFLAYALGVVKDIPPDVSNAALDLIRYLAYAFTLTVLVNLVFMLIIAILERLVGALKGTRIQYR